MTCILSNRGVEIDAPVLHARIGTAGIDRLFEMLTLRHESKIGADLVTCLARRELVGGIYRYTFPHTLVGRMHLIGITCNNSNMRPRAEIAAQLQVELFQNQRLVVDRLVKCYTPERVIAGTAGAILNMRAGLGKTFVAAGVIAATRMRTLFAVPNSELARQAYDDLTECFGDGAKIGISGGKPGKRRKSAADDDITIAIINTALGMAREDLERYSLLILDEVHTCCSQVRRQIFTAAQFHAVLGMSATTENRPDEMDKVAHHYIAHDGVIFAEKIPGFTFEDVKFTVHVAVIKYYGSPEHTRAISHPSTGKLFTPYMMKQFFSDDYRTAAIVGRITARYRAGGNIYVFAEEIGFLERVGELLRVEVPADEIVLFTGGLDDADAARARATGRILLATYGYAGTGISIPKMTAIVFASPRRENMIQILARVQRRGSDTAIIRTIDDFVDENTPMKSQLRSRRAAYAHYECKIDVEKMYWTSFCKKS